MCVIIVKEKGAKIPTKETLENCFERNSDGAGFMYVNDKGRVVIDKGYMNFNHFYKHYEKLCKKYNNFEGKNLVMHMRISTAGGVKKENTHPFALTNDYNEMKRTYIKCDMGVVHNGVISCANPSKEEEKKGINDTMVFIKNYLYPIHKNWKDCFKNNAFTLGIEIMTNSKFAILDNRDNLTIIGDFKKHEECLFSNDSYNGKYYYKKYKTDTKDYDYNYGYGYDYDYYADYWADAYDEYLRKKKEREEMYEKMYEEIDKVGETEDTEDFEDIDYPLVKCEDDDMIVLNDEFDSISIEELRTEDKSTFYYDYELFALYEKDENGDLLNTYYNTYLIRSDEIYDSNYSTDVV